jgi:hypothetical protein
MTSTENAPRVRRVPAPGWVVIWCIGSCLLVIVTLLVGVGIAALLARQGASADWNRWSDVGQTFGALSSIISGLALVAVVAIARAQYREMQQNRREMEHQRASLIGHHMELRRAAAANLGMFHLEILKMSIEDPELAEVWPPFAPNLPADINRKYLYANAIYQFQLRVMTESEYSDEQITASLRYLFTSPHMRGYWRAAAFARTTLPAGSRELALTQQIDEICREFEAVASSAPSDDTHGTTALHDRQTSAQVA